MLLEAFQDPDVHRFERLAAVVRQDPAALPAPAALARACGLARPALDALVTRHAHRAAAAWLERERTRAACRELAAPRRKIAVAAERAGFASPAAFGRACRRHLRLTPEQYRRLGSALGFDLSLPPRFRPANVLDYHRRDPQSPCEQVHGRRIFKALLTPDGGAVLEIALDARFARCRAHAKRRLGRASMRLLHDTALRLLGLAADVSGFERDAAREPRMAALIARRPGLRLPLAATVFDGLCWAIVGQQINLAFASALRRDLIALAGTPVDRMRAHPSPAQIASVDVGALRRKRFSRAKCAYLTEAARAALDGRLDLEALADGSALRAEAALTAVRGIGTWTARYVLMRGCGFADCAPVGDVALAAALQRYAGLAERPSHGEVEDLMRPFSPHRSLATFHLWASLKD